MSRGQAAVIARHALETSHAGSPAKARGPGRSPNARESETPTPLSNQALGQMLGGGTPLEGSVRAEMESRFGIDFSTVRIHDEPMGHGMAQQRWAQAFTVDNHIAFNRGRFAPGRPDGKHLLAHELAHVVQQRRGGTAVPTAGGSLEQAAERASAQVVSGCGPVAVAGAGAVAVARQPLPENEMPNMPAPPRTLSGSLAKDENNLSHADLDREMTLMEAWLVDLPNLPGNEFLVAEYKALYAERAARSARRAPPRGPRLQAKEGSVASLYGNLEDAPMQAVEIQEAHRAYLATGEMFQTRVPVSWIEIKKGKPMSRAQRYDEMLVKHGVPLAQVEDVVMNNFDPEYLTQKEFEEEFYARVHREHDECRDLWFKGRQNKCIRGVDDKYGGPAFKADRADKEMRLRQQILEVSDKIAAVRDSGAMSLAGRVIGYGAGALTGHDAMRWSEHGADIGAMTGVLGSARVGYTQKPRMQSYNAGGGLQVRRDADIHWMTQRSYGANPMRPDPVPPARLTPGGSSAQSAAAPAPSTPIPISSGKGLPQSDASKVLQSNLAKLSPDKAGSVTPLPMRKPDILPKPDPAQQNLPAVAAAEGKIAVGQTHGAGGTIATGVTPTTSLAGAGAQSAVASLKTPSRPSKTTGTSTGSVKSSVASTSKGTATTPSAGVKPTPPAKLPTKPLVKTGAKKTAAAPVPVNASGGRGTNAERLVAVRVQGGGAAGKGTGPADEGAGTTPATKVVVGDEAAGKATPPAKAATNALVNPEVASANTAKPVVTSGAAKPPAVATAHPDAPVSIASAKGKPQSQASKALDANLAKQAPEKTGSVTSLRPRKSGGTLPTEPASQPVPAVLDVAEQVAVGQSHGAGGATGGKPKLSVVGGGGEPAVATLKRPGGKVPIDTGTPADGSVTAVKPTSAPAKTASRRDRPAARSKGRPQTPSDEFSDFKKMLSDDFGATGEVSSGKLIQLYRHGSRATVTKYLKQSLIKQAQALAGGSTGEPKVLTIGEFKLELKPGQSVSEQIDSFVKNLEGAHSMPQAFGKKLPKDAIRDLRGGKYNPDDALVQFTPKPTHTQMDQPWKDTFNKIRASGGNTRTAAEVFDSVADGIRKTPGMSDAEQTSRIARLHDEMFTEMKLDPGRSYPVPRIYTWADILGFKAKAKRGRP